MAAVQAHNARRTEEKNRAEIEKEQRRRENLFNRRYHQDMTDRTEVQSMLRELREQQDAQRGLDEARGAVMGETSEQQLAEQNSRNKAYAEGLAGMTRNASTLKDSYLDRYDNSLANYYQQRRDANTRTAQMQQQSSNMAAVAASNAMNAAANMGVAAAGAMDNGGVKKAPAAPASQAPFTPANTKSGQYQNAAAAASSPLEQTIYRDMATAARQQQGQQSPQTSFYPEDYFLYKKSPYMVR